MDEMKTPEQFHAGLREQFEQYLDEVRAGKVQEFYFLESEGVEYNSWLEHRYGWPLTRDLLCGVSLSSLDDKDDLTSGEEVPFEDCYTCLRLVEMYRDYCSKYRIERERSRQKRSNE